MVIQQPGHMQFEGKLSATIGDNPKLLFQYISMPNHLTACHDLNGSERNVLSVILMLMDETNYFNYTESKELMVEVLQNTFMLTYGKSTITNTLSKFSKKEILIRLGKGEYIINPEYFCSIKGFNNIPHIMKLVEDAKLNQSISHSLATREPKLESENINSGW